MIENTFHIPTYRYVIKMEQIAKTEQNIHICFSVYVGIFKEYIFFQLKI